MGLGLSVLCLMSYAAVWSLQPTPITGSKVFALLGCHDDTHIDRTWTHGNPNDGTFGTDGAAPNHSNGYYYLNVQAASGCGAGTDGQYHYVLHVTVAGPLADGSPGGIGHPKRSGAAIANEHPAWGFETKDGSRSSTLKCTGGDGSGGYPSQCPNSPPATVTGNDVAEWRYDGSQSSISQRVDNQYDEVLWEYATLDVVACSTCEPGGSTSGVTPTPTPSGSGGQPTPTPTATPTPTQPVPRTAGCSSSPATDVFQRTAAAGRSTSVYVSTSNVGTITATVRWTPRYTADLIVYDAGSLRVISRVTGSSGTLTSSIDNLPATAYKIKVHNDGAGAITFTLSVIHC